MCKYRLKILWVTNQKYKSIWMFKRKNYYGKNQADYQSSIFLSAKHCEHTCCMLVLGCRISSTENSPENKTIFFLKKQKNSTTCSMYRNGEDCRTHTLSTMDNFQFTHNRSYLSLIRALPYFEKSAARNLY